MNNFSSISFPSNSTNKDIIIIGNTSWYLYNFRIGLLNRLLNSGHRLTILAPLDEYSKKIQQLGCSFHELEMDNQSLNPFKDFLLFRRIKLLLIHYKPDLVIHYTIKPVIYGSLVSNKFNIPFVNNITGLGTVFIKKSFITYIVKVLYRISQKRASYLFFQNQDDKIIFKNERLVPSYVPSIVFPGTGIDTSFFPFKSYKSSTSNTFLLIARIIWDKGIGEFVEAANEVKKYFPNSQFQLLGYLDVLNRTAISHQQIEAWTSDGIIHYLGESEDVRPFLKKAGCVVLPSYREGLPRSLLEAAAMCRPIIATDVSGCRDVVEHGVNGYLCKTRDAHDLAQKMKDMIRLSIDEKRKMGLRGREKMKQNFDQKVIVEKIVDCIESVLNTA